MPDLARSQTTKAYVGPVARDARRAEIGLERLAALARANYFMPPDHGASVVTTVLDDPGLEASWRGELDAMRTRIARLREEFADALRSRSNASRFDAVARHRGMFSLLPLTPDQVDALRERHGVYLIRDGRMSVAGLPEDPVRMAALADAIVSVTAGGLEGVIRPSSRPCGHRTLCR